MQRIYHISSQTFVSEVECAQFVEVTSVSMEQSVYALLLHQLSHHAVGVARPYLGGFGPVFHLNPATNL